MEATYMKGYQEGLFDAFSSRRQDRAFEMRKTYLVLQSTGMPQEDIGRALAHIFVAGSAEATAAITEEVYKKYE